MNNNLIELKKYRERLMTALKSSNISVFEVDLQQQLYTFFENAEVIFGISGEEILRAVQQFSKLSPEDYQKAVSDYFSHPDDAEIIDRAFRQILTGQPATYYARMKAGRTSFKWCKLDVTPILESGIPVRMIGVITDIDDLKSRADLFEKKSRNDDFTELFTKTYAVSQIKKILTQKPFQKHALILLDIDNFKSINDTYGHMAGDKVLKALSAALKRCFSQKAVLGRFGGDEFIVFLQNLQDPAALCQKLDSLLTVHSENYSVTNSFGVAIFPDDADNYDCLFARADHALYTAKRTKNKYILFSEI